VFNHPVYVGETNSSYFFRWETSAACPLADSQPTDPSKGKPLRADCSVIDPITSEAINLATLDKTLLSLQAYNATFSLAICKPLAIGGPCTAAKNGAAAANVSVCQVDANGNVHVAGRAPPTYTIVENVITLTFASGDPCHNGAYNRTAKIDLTCDPTSTATKPTFAGESGDCIYAFQWSTPYACSSTQLPLDCTATLNNSIYDLSDLRLVLDNWDIPVS
jgi:hypothetical protein